MNLVQKDDNQQFKKNKLFDELFSVHSIRIKCHQIFDLTLENKTNFKLNLHKLDDVAQLVCQVILKHYPQLNIPFHSLWSHFYSNKSNKMQEFSEKTENYSHKEIIKAKLTLIIMNALLEGPSGIRWRYKIDKKEYTRAEGQSMACFRMFMDGFFSNHVNKPLRVDGQKLKNITLDNLQKEFQSGENNLLIGMEERLKTLHNLGNLLENNHEYFGNNQGHLGNLLDYILEISSCYNNTLSCANIFKIMHGAFGSLLYNYATYEGMNLGDVWHYQPFGNNLSAFIPFHKRLQWITYSILEPLTEQGLSISKISELTGLAEYRNGGLMLDSGLLELKDHQLADLTHTLDSEVIIEWRALTIILLDKLAKIVAQKLGKTMVEFPLARVLEGGTWLAGRELAQKLREDASAPLKVQNFGIGVF